MKVFYNNQINMKKGLFFICAFIALLTTSCNQFKKTKTGLQYKIYGNGKGKKLAEGGFVKFNMVKKWKDSVMFTTYGTLPGYNAIRKMDMQVHDFPDIMLQLRVGDSVMMIQNYDTLRKMQMALPPGATRNDKFVTTIKIVEYYDSLGPAMNDYIAEVKKQVVRENVKIEDYLKKNNVPNVVKSKDGIYVSVIKEGDGAKMDSGKFARVNYTGRVLNGPTFDSNLDSTFGHVEPFDFHVGQDGLFFGWSWGMEVFKQGGKGIIYVPPSAGFGKNGDGQGRVKGDDIITFDVEILGVSDTAFKSSPHMPRPGR